MDFTTKEVIEMILSFLFGSGLSFHFTRKYYIQKSNKIIQNQQSSGDSHNYQAGGDINIGEK